jgi:N-acetylneuraminate synthase/N,N'-diacetyllegionaminate synthase
MKTLRIGPRAIGRDLPVLVIAEIGVNHDGSLDRAIELASVAAACGADAVKFQIFRAEALMHSTSEMAGYQRSRLPSEDALTMLRTLELSHEQMRQLVEAIDAMELLPLATPFSPADVDVIESLRLPAIKIASPDMVNRVLLERCAATYKPLLISTGAATMDEVTATVGWLDTACCDFGLLHCVSSYPAPPEQAHLAWIGELGGFDVPVGFSDHSTEITMGALAVSAGAVVIEKHLTYDCQAPGPDHAASADPDAFEEYVRQIRVAEQIRGRSGKRVLECEQDVRHVSRQSLVLLRDLNPGEEVDASDLTVQRPGRGIPAAEIQRAIGRRARTSLAAGTMLTWDMLSDAA